MNQEKNPDQPCSPKKNEWIKMILMSLLWLLLMALSFISYYAIPAMILITWAIIAWAVKACKGDKGGGSGYDSEF